MDFYGDLMTRSYKTLACLILFSTTIEIRADDWPQWMGPQRDGVWRERGIIEKFPAGGPKVRWRVPVGGGYSSPSVAGGKVFVIDRKVKENAAKPSSPFQRISVPGVERVLCLDEATGKTLWMEQYPCDYTMSYNSGPRAAPTVDGKEVYTFGGEGDLQCRRIKDGKLIWQKHLGGDKTPMWGFSSSPLIDGDKVIVFGADPAGRTVALNKRTGEPLWQGVPAEGPGAWVPGVF